MLCRPGGVPALPARRGGGRRGLGVAGWVDGIVALDAVQPRRGPQVAGQERGGGSLLRVPVVVVEALVVAAQVRVEAEVTGRLVVRLRPEEFGHRRRLVVTGEVDLYELFARAGGFALRDGRLSRSGQGGQARDGP